METFKASVGEKVFYFKTKDNGESFIIDPYQQKGLKAFKLAKNDGAWMIPAEEKVPEDIRSMEAVFGDRINERQMMGS